MRLFLILFLVEGFFSFILKDIIDRELLAVLYVLINSLYLLCWSHYKAQNKELFIILALGLFARLGAMMYDLNIATLPFNTTDSQVFHKFAIETANALPNTLLEHYTGFYSQFLGVIYYIFGPYKFLGHFINIAFVILSTTKLLDIAQLLKLKQINQKILVGLWLFMPIPFLMSNTLLREASIYYLIVLSVYYFLKWVNNQSLLTFTVAIFAVISASLFHEGVIVLGVVYIYTLLFYQRKHQKIGIRMSNTLVIIVTLILGLGYLGSEAGQEFINKTNAETGGGSTYLADVEVETPIEFLLVGPIKAVYLMYSPMPWLVRNSLDIITLLLDSMFWIYVTYQFFKQYKNIKTEYRMLFLAVCLCCFVFGMGTHNTGTAIRHRNKFMSIILIIYIYLKDHHLDKRKERYLA